MPKILKRPQAKIDLIDIWLFIADDSQQNADQYLHRIENVMTVLAGQPLMGQNRDDIKANIRSFPAESHVLFYYALDDGIEVVRVLHEAQDIENIF